ncbi:hypothetical protein NDU88_002735 [Pleurodeles waltl]|uniref:Uncharacterized protein n=1 Tax=Pleurodeles waltl TaxID=8319 RepID=A0AAV7P953_PLEWA|nr:hypothetical protein NDU88_002735 [Pleurodeles waltl]
MEKRGAPDIALSRHRPDWAPRCPLFCAKRGGGTLLSLFVLRNARQGGQQQLDLHMRLRPRLSFPFVRALLLAVPTCRGARTAAGASRSQVCRESGPGSSDTSPELRRLVQGPAFFPRPHLDVIFASCGAELF